MENKPSAVSNSPMKLGNTSEDSRNDIQMVLAKMMEEKHTYTYKKLVVPPSMRSIYWKFFGFPATEDGDILTKVKIVCILCKTQIAYNRNTSNLRMHLQNKHAQELLELESSNPPCRQIVSQDNKERKAQKRSLKAGLSPAKYIYTTNADGTVQIDGDIQFVTDPNIMLSNIEDDITIGQPLRVMIKGGSNINNSNQNVAYLMSDDNATNQSDMDGKILSDAVAEFIVMDLQLPEIVEGYGFQRLVATLHSPCEIPSQNKLQKEIIPKIYHTFRESVAGLLACITSEIALTFEEWKTKKNESYVTISVYYLNIEEEAELECKILNTIHAPSDWEETHWDNMIDSLVFQWDIKVEKITAAVVSSSRPELIMALTNRGWTLVPCLLHTLQTCAQACFDNPDVAHILSKCRMVIGIITSHPQICTTLTLQEQLSTVCYLMT